MRSRQRGATFIGMVVIIAILGFALYAGIRLTPMYLEYMAVARALEHCEGGRGRADHAAAAAQCARPPLDDRNIDSVISRKTSRSRRPAPAGPCAPYRAEAPFIGNVSLVADFDKTVDVQLERPAHEAGLKTAREWLHDALGYELPRRRRCSKLR